MISRLNYSDDYGSSRGPGAPVFASDEYGAPVSPVISSPYYPDDKHGFNTGPGLEPGQHYGGGRPLYTEDRYQYYPPGPPVCSCTDNYQPYPPHYTLVSPPTLPPLPPAPVTPGTNIRHEPCLELHTTLEFQLESPGLTVPGSQCEFIILPADNVCSLSLTFTWFFLPRSLNCTEEFLQIGGNRLCGELTDRQVNLWLPYGEAWELKYQAGSRYHGDYFGFRIQAVQNLCTTTTRSTSTTNTTRRTDDEVVVIDNCELSGDCEEGGGRTLALETTTFIPDYYEEPPFPDRRIAG